MSTRFGALLEAAERRLVAEAEALGRAVDTPTELGIGREDALRRELRAFLPTAYQLTSGFVVGNATERSEQQDILIYDAFRYPAAAYADGRQLLVPESVFGAISVKSRIRPGELEDLFTESDALKNSIATTLGEPWRGPTVLFAYRAEGDWNEIEKSYFEMVASRPRWRRLDLICVMGRPLLLDGHAFGLADDRKKGFGGMAGTADFFIPIGGGKGNDMTRIQPSSGTFVGLYQLLLTRLSGMKLPPLRTMTLPRFIDSTVRAEDVLAAQLVAPPGTSPPDDSRMRTTCPTCRSEQRLSEAQIVANEESGETVYRCKNGCQAILIVGEPGGDPWPGRGYRLGDRVLRNPADVFLETETGASVVLPASPAALMSKRPKS